MNVQGDAIRLRLYPYPYQGALSICNDLDGTSLPDSLEIHRLLNTTLNTTLGPGLGLEIGDSFWMFRAEPGREPTYFLKASTKPSPFAPLLRDLIQMGYVDCLHTFDDFNRVGGFRRELAMAAFEELERQQLKLRVWIDHGDIHNFQNLATPWSMGDLPLRTSADGTRTPTAEYHADLTLAHGIRFIWTGLTPFPEVGALVLDVGCGQSPYRSWFARACYVGTDYRLGGQVAFISRGETLPIKTAVIDAVILTQVLAYTKEPVAVLEEINRALRQGGRIFLTEAQVRGLHYDPPDYYRFTRFGLEYLMERAGFEVIFIQARGGYFWYLAKRLLRLPSALFPRTARLVWRILSFLPRAMLARIIDLLIVPFCILLDRLDHERDYTLGYACYAVKSESKNG